MKLTFTETNSHLLKQHPAALVRTIICSELKDGRHLIIIHLIMNVKVALLPAALGAAIKDAPLDGADVPPNDWPVEEDAPANQSVSLGRSLLREGQCGLAWRGSKGKALGRFTWCMGSSDGEFGWAVRMGSLDGQFVWAVRMGSSDGQFGWAVRMWSSDGEFGWGVRMGFGWSSSPSEQVGVRMKFV